MRESKKSHLPHPKPLSSWRGAYNQYTSPLSVYGEGLGEGLRFLNTLMPRPYKTYKQ